MKKRNLILTSIIGCLLLVMLCAGCNANTDTTAKTSTKEKVETILNMDATPISTHGRIPKSGYAYLDDEIEEIIEHHEAETHVVHHEAVTHEKPVYETIHHEAETEQVWVVDQEEYDETYDVCEKCGEKR